MTRAKRLGDILTEATLRRYGIVHDVRRQAALEAAWREAAGEPLAGHVRVGLFEAGELTLLVNSPVWGSRLRLEQAALLERLRAREEFRSLLRLHVRITPSAFVSQS